MSLLQGRAFAGVMLVVVLAFAGGAVALLTLTLLESEQIEDNADQVAQRIGNANRDLEAVRLADRTSDIARSIAVQLRPLDEQLAKVVRNTASIDRTTGSIAATVLEINDGANVLNRLVASINGQVESVEARVAAVLGNVRSINDRFGRVLSTTRSIDRGVAGINTRAEAVIARAAEVERGLTAVLQHVGPGHGRLLDQPIAGHAHSIDCSVLLQPEPYCTR